MAAGTGTAKPTRREIGMGALAATAAIAWSGTARAQGITAAAVADRIRQRAGSDWKASETDGFAAGDPTITVLGVAVVASPDLAALREAVRQGCNMVVSPESPLYARPLAARAGAAVPAGPAQTAERLRADPTYAAKLAYIRDERLAVYRLHDNLHVAGPRLLAAGIADALGWQRRAIPGEDAIFAVPATSLRAIATLVKRRLGLNGGMRVIGRGEMRVARVLVAPGRIDPVSVVKRLPDVDLLIAGDLREWELVEYFADSWQTAQPKALIATGRIMSEQPGMSALAAWLRPVAGVPVRTLPVADPYWRLPA